MDLERSWIESLGKLRKPSDVLVYSPKFNKGALICRPVPSVNLKFTKEYDDDLEKAKNILKRKGFNELAYQFSEWLRIYHTVEFHNNITKERDSYILAPVFENKSISEFEEEHPLFKFHNYLKSKNKYKRALKKGVDEDGVFSKLGYFALFPAIVIFDGVKKVRNDESLVNVVAIKNTAVKSLVKELVNLLPTNAVSPDDGVYLTIASSEYFNESSDDFSKYVCKADKECEYVEKTPSEFYSKINPNLIDISDFEDKINDIQTYEYMQLIDSNALNPQEVLEFLEIMEAPSEVVKKCEMKYKLYEMKRKYNEEILSKIGKLSTKDREDMQSSSNPKVDTDVESILSKAVKGLPQDLQNSMTDEEEIKLPPQLAELLKNINQK